MSSLSRSFPMSYGPATGSTRVAAPWMHGLVVILAICLAVPVLEVPLFGFSLSAPVFGFLAAGCLLRPIDWRPYLKWIVPAGLFWMAQLFSLTANIFSGATPSISSDQAVLILRFAYWLLVFVVVTLLVHRFRLGERVARALAFGAYVLGMLRLTEAALFGHWGGGNPQFLSQNDYGLGFSTFTPFGAWLVFEAHGRRRLVAFVAWVFLLVAILGNGSRSSWGAVILGLLAVVCLWGLTRARNIVAAISALSFAAIIVAGIVWLAPAALREPVVQRASTLESLDRDKPYLARQLLVEKGIRLFVESPLFGAGSGAFTHRFVAMELPAALGEPSLDDFNRKTPHNAYIKVLAETGILGAGTLLCLLALLAVRGLPAAVALTRRGETWGIPVFAAFVGMSVHFWTLSGLTGTAPWFVYGLLAALIETRRDFCS